MLDGTIDRKFEVYDVDVSSDRKLSESVDLGNKKLTTFEEILKKLRAEKEVLPRPLIGHPQKGVASVEDRVFGLNKKLSNLFTKGVFTEDRGTKPNEMTEFLAEFERLKESIKKNDGMYSQILLDCLIELSDIWYQQQVFEYDMKNTDQKGFVYTPKDHRRIKEVQQYFDISLNKLVSQLSKYTDKKTDELSELVMKFGMQKYYIRSVLGKNDISEALVKEACVKLI
jgi:hypothetical protein